MTKKTVTEALLWMISICGTILKAVYFQFSSGVSEMPFFSRINNNMYISLFGSVILIISAVLLLFNRKRLLVLILVSTAASLLLLADTLYYRYFQNLMTVTVLNQIRLLGAVEGSVRSLLRRSDILFALDLPFLCLGTVVLKKRFKGGIARIRPIFRICAALLLLIGGLGLSRFAYNRSSQGTFAYDNKYVANNLGIFNFHYYDTDRFIRENYIEDRSLKAEERKEIEDFFGANRNTGYRYKGTASGRNLVIIQMEAIQQFLVNFKWNGYEITPNLNHFIHDSVYLNNFYSQIGAGNTSDAEFLANTSLYPLGDAPVYFRFPGNTYDSISRRLSAMNYEPLVFHANYPSFWNRMEMYRSLGFSQFVSSRDFIMDDYRGWGLSDRSFFRQAMDLADVAGPVYSFMISLTSHHPYNFFGSGEGFDAGGLEDTMAGDYLKAANYVDEAVGELLYDLKRRGLYNNSIIILYGDHFAFPKDQNEFLSELTGYKFSEYNWVKYQRVPCFIRFPGLKETGVNRTVCGQLDLFPTIANLMGFDAPYAIGHDIFNNTNGHAVLRNSTVITSDFTYVAAEDKVYDKKGKSADKGLYEGEIAKYQYELKISDLILHKDALKYIMEDEKKGK
ncbi:MAG TPA: LTA synthase family protein [Clostridia bacterium]|nr:LTA synthase family protein [Clostridia bacterium]